MSVLWYHMNSSIEFARLVIMNQSVPCIQWAIVMLLHTAASELSRPGWVAWIAHGWQYQCKDCWTHQPVLLFVATASFAVGCRFGQHEMLGMLAPPDIVI